MALLSRIVPVVRFIVGEFGPLIVFWLLAAGRSA